MTKQLILDDDLNATLQTIERQTGLEASAVIRVALQEKLARVERERTVARRLAELKIVLERLTPPAGEASYMTDAEGDAWMYDEHGLPH